MELIVLNCVKKRARNDRAETAETSSHCSAKMKNREKKHHNSHKMLHAHAFVAHTWQQPVTTLCSREASQEWWNAFHSNREESSKQAPNWADLRWILASNNWEQIAMEMKPVMEVQSREPAPPQRQSSTHIELVRQSQANTDVEPQRRELEERKVNEIFLRHNCVCCSFFRFHFSSAAAICVTMFNVESSLDR